MMRPLRAAGWVGKHLVRAVWASLMVLTPLFGFWLASSLAAYSNASQWLALVVGLLLFPLVPVGWDLVFVWRRRGRPPRKSILTRLDRLVLRTLLVNGLFLGAMLWRAPQTSFRALAVRGDWIVDGHHGPVAEAVRGFLLGVADQFERRWHATNTEYGTSDKPPEDVGDDLAPEPTPVPAPGMTPTRAPGQWPLPADADPIVVAMPEAAQTSVDSVASYLAARITDRRLLVKALHDYVVLRLSYDTATFELRGEERYTKRPSQQAADVFAARTAVCEGYARLMVALGDAAGIEIAYVTGFVRTSERRIDDAASDEAITSVLEGYRHAWNAVKLDGTWLLLDATWDDPVGAGPTLRSTYLFTPPRLFRYDHLPEEPAWQLVSVPLSAGEFARQPLMSPESGALGLVLESPTRSQVSVDNGRVRIVLANPQGAHVVGEIRRAGAREGNDCTTDASNSTRVSIECKVGAGEYEVRMFAKLGAKAGSYPHVGTLLVNGR